MDTNIRKWHRWMGALLILPFLAWAGSGFFFFIKPGYAEAYASLQPKTYPLARSIRLEARPDWLEIQFLRTVLGEHLLVRTAAGRLHLDAETLAPQKRPGSAAIRELVTDAIAANPGRYGSVVSVEGFTATTTTGVTVSLNWETLSLYQRGADTRRIDWVYKIHYLQWTGVKSLDRVLGVAGLILVCLMTLSGIRLLTLKPSAVKPNKP